MFISSSTRCFYLYYIVLSAFQKVLTSPSICLNLFPLFISVTRETPLLLLGYHIQKLLYIQSQLRVPFFIKKNLHIWNLRNSPWTNHTENIIVYSKAWRNFFHLGENSYQSGWCHGPYQVLVFDVFH
jgi:hypothetical protein